jgi:uncharacterized membrane protein YkvA (DUF1232 family)
VDVRLILGLILGVVAVWVALLIVLWVFRPRGVSVREIAAVVPDLLRLLRSLIADGSVPVEVRIILVGLVTWIVSPIDLIPEFIPGLGPLDDVIVSIVALRYVRRRLGLDALRARWVGSEQGFAVLIRVIGTGT